MALFVKKITDPEEAFQRLIKKDKKASDGAKAEFVASMNHGLVEFLCDKFNETPEQENRLLILETFSAYKENLSEEDFRIILKLFTNSDVLLKEVFKEILSGLNEHNLKAATEILTTSMEPDVHKTIQYGIENSGVLGRILEKWNKFSLKDQIIYIEEIVLIQSPKTYPIFLEIMKEEANEANKDDKKILQVEFSKHLDKIKNPDFMDLCIKELPLIASSMRYPLFKSLQGHGKAFFEKFFDGLSKKSENLRLQSIKIMDQLVDPNSYPYLFPYLLDTAKSVPSTTAEAISKIVKNFCDELEGLGEEGRKSKAIKEKLDYFVTPLVLCLDDSYSMVIKSITECIIRIGKFEENVILANLPLIYKHSESYFTNYLRGLDVNNRKRLLIKACCYENIETGKTALTLLSDPSEGYVIETLNTLILEHFLSIPKAIQVGIINLMNDPKMQNYATEIINHKDPEFRKNIVKTLGESGAPNALTLIGTKIRDPEVSIREEILNILDLPHFKNMGALDLMIVLLSDINADLVIKTIEKIREYDEPKVILALTKLLSCADQKLRKSAHEAIAYITKRKYLSGFLQMSPEARLAVGMSLIKMDPTFLEETTKNLSDNEPSVRLLSAQILESLYLSINPDLKANLIVAIQDPDPKVRSVVVMILGRIGGVSVEALLVSCLSDRDDRVRANAVEALLSVADISIADKILPCLTDTNNRVRGNAIMTLWKLGYYKVYDSIVEMFRSNDKWMRASVAFAIGELKDIRFLPVLVNNLNDKDPDVRRNVVKALSKVADPYTLAPYIRPLRFDTDEKVRKEVAAALTIKQQPRY